MQQDILRQVREPLERLQRRFRGLSRRSRWITSMLSAAVFVSLLVASVTLRHAGSLSAGDGYVEVLKVRDDPTRLQRAVATLEGRQIPWRSSVDADGTTCLEVPRGEAQRQALEHLGGGSAGARGSTAEGGLEAEWPFAKSSPWEGPERFDSRLREFNRQRIEKAILWNPAIERATIVLAEGPRTYGPRGRASATAAVALQLRPGVAALAREEVDAIRGMVSAGFNIRRVEISAGGICYPALPESDSQLEISGLEQRTRESILDLIRRHYSKIFQERQFEVGVLVSLSPKSASIEERSVDRENSFSLLTRTQRDRLDPGPSGGLMSASEPHDPVVAREVEESTPLESWKKTQTEVPPGSVDGISVLVHLDRFAVVRLAASSEGIATLDPAAGEGLAAQGVASDPTLEERIASFRSEEERCLRTMLGMYENVNVIVDVRPFAGRDPPSGPASLIAPPAIASGPPDSAAAVPAASEPPMADPESAIRLALWVAVGTLAGFAALVLLHRRRLRHQRASVPSPRSGPAHGPSMKGGAADGAALSIALTESARAEAMRPRAGGASESVLEWVGELNRTAQEKPDEVAAVLRRWLSEGELPREVEEAA